MSSGVVALTLSQSVQPVCLSWGLWLLLNTSRCLLGFLLVPTLMFVGVWTVKGGGRGQTGLIKCSQLVPTISDLPFPTHTESNLYSELVFLLRLLCPPVFLTHLPVSHSLSLHLTLLVSSTHSAHKASLIPPTVPCPVFTPICENHEIHTEPGWKTNTPFLCLACASPHFISSNLSLCCLYRPRAKRSQQSLFHQIQSVLSCSAATVPLRKNLGATKRHKVSNKKVAGSKLC